MTHQKVRALAKRLGVIVEVTHDCGVDEILVNAPDGKHWVEGVVHQLVYSQRQGPWGMADGWKDIFKRMEHGLEDCDIDGNTDCADVAES